MLIPRITDTLRTIARGASATDSKLYSTPFADAESREVVVESGVIEINRNLLESWYSQGKKIHVKSYTNLTVKDDVDPALFDAVVERIKCYGGLRIPTEVFTRVSHKIRSMGGVETY